eukprot:4272930-Pyramimonas_sp.AAC.1
MLEMRQACGQGTQCSRRKLRARTAGSLWEGGPTVGRDPGYNSAFNPPAPLWGHQAVGAGFA